jgi:hypothetical protein
MQTSLRMPMHASARTSAPSASLAQKPCSGVSAPTVAGTSFPDRSGRRRLSPLILPQGGGFSTQIAAGSTNSRSQNAGCPRPESNMPRGLGTRVPKSYLQGRMLPLTPCAPVIAPARLGPSERPTFASESRPLRRRRPPRSGRCSSSWRSRGSGAHVEAQRKLTPSVKGIRTRRLRRVPATPSAQPVWRDADSRLRQTSSATHLPLRLPLRPRPRAGSCPRKRRARPSLSSRSQRMKSRSNARSSTL